MKKFKFLEHTADVKFLAFGKTLEEAFENSALALTHVICEEKIKKKKNEKISKQIEGTDIQGVLQNFLEDFLFLFETKRFLLSSVKKLKIEKKSGAFFLHCEIAGDDAKNYKLNSHVKAVTYNDMFIKKEKGIWKCQVVLDV